MQSNSLNWSHRHSVTWSYL